MLFRRDLIWNHGIDVNGKKSKIKYNYCQNITNGGIKRLEQHLAYGTYGGLWAVLRDKSYTSTKACGSPACGVGEA